MYYIVLDLEWNQSCLGAQTTTPHMPFEIIEIGAVKLNEKLETVSEFHQFVSPSVYNRMHFYTGELTNITMEELTVSPKFPKVIKDFIAWCGDDYSFCTWGPSDITELQRNMNYHHIPLFKFPVYFYDLQKLFSILYEDGKARSSLENAITFFNIPVSRDFHRAINDAKYTAEIMKQLDMDIVKTFFSIDTYQIPANDSQAVYKVYKNDVYGSYSKYISRGFPSKNDVMEDKNVIATPCFLCGRKLKKKIRWFSSNAKTYYCLSYCPEHGYMRGKIRMKKTDSGEYFAVRTLKFTKEDGVSAIYAKQADIRKKRKQKRLRAKNDN